MRLAHALLLATVLLGGCAEVQLGSHLFKKRLNEGCQTEGAPKVGNPYLVDGIRYEPMKSSLEYREKGIASWYGSDFHGKSTANGECYNMYAFTAAHKTLPLPTVVRVTNLENNRSVVVKVNDRGPFVRGRIMDLSYAAAQSLDIVRYGTAPVLIEAIGGPHHYANGYRGGSYKLANQLGRNDQIAETLPSIVPQTADEEDLAPLPATPQPTKAEIAQERKLGVPPPAENLPAPPAYEDRVFTDTEALTKTQVYVQVGAYGEETNAITQQQTLARLYPTASISAVQSGAKTLHRVRAGPFRSVADAEAALDKIVSAGFNGAQIKVEN